MIAEDSQGVIAALVNHSLTSLKTLTSTIQYNHAQVSQVNSCLARFKLWAGNVGAHRSSGRRSLEYRLRDASHIRKLVISLLQDLCASINQGILVATGYGYPGTTSEVQNSLEDDLADYFNDDGNSDKSEIEKILDEVSHVIACLLKLSATIRNPAPHDQFLSRMDEGLVESFVYWDAKHVREKFRNVNERIVGRLGRAMARRRLYFKYRKEHRDRLVEGLDEDHLDLEERATTIASSLPEHLKGAGEITETRLVQSNVLDDRCSGTSLTSYASSNPETTQLRVPPLPKEYMDGPFKCPFCQMMVSIETRYDWKKHVFRDIRPYVCLEEACQTPECLYMRRQDWVMHMRREHWKTWHCPFGCEAVFDRAEGLQDHVKIKHEHDLSSQNIYALDDLSSHTNVEKAKGQCPLCYNFQINSEKQYEKHVGQHLEDFALFTLPDEGKEGDKEHEREEERLGDEDEDEAEDDEDEEYWHDKHDLGSKAFEAPFQNHEVFKIPGRTVEEITEGSAAQLQDGEDSDKWSTTATKGPGNASGKAYHCNCGKSFRRHDNLLKHQREYGCRIRRSQEGGGNFV